MGCSLSERHRHAGQMWESRRTVVSQQGVVGEDLRAMRLRWACGILGEAAHELRIVSATLSALSGQVAWESPAARGFRDSVDDLEVRALRARDRLDQVEGDAAAAWGRALHAHPGAVW